MWLTAPDCERARMAVSLELDGELSELEHGYLEWHVVQCRACYTYRADVTATTSLIRRQAPEPTPQVTFVLGRGPIREYLSRVATSGVALVLVGLLAATQLGRVPSGQSRFRVDARSAGSAKELRQIYSEFRFVDYGTSSLPSSGRVL